MTPYDDDKAKMESGVDRAFIYLRAAWLQAFRVGRCATCTEQVVSCIFETLHDHEEVHGNGCLKFCGDAAPEDPRGFGWSAGDWDQMLTLWVMLKKGWDAALQVFGCRSCALAVLRGQSRRMADEARSQMTDGRSHEGYKRDCARCRAEAGARVPVRLMSDYECGVERIWIRAVELHGCTGCAAASVQSMFEVVTEELGSWLCSDCAGSCRDGKKGAKAEADSGLAADAVLRVTGFASMEMLFEVAAEIEEAWKVLDRVVNCDGCLNAKFARDIGDRRKETNDAVAAGDLLSVVTCCRQCSTSASE